MNREAIHTYLRYSDWANRAVIEAALPLHDDCLDERFDIGRGTLRKTLLHIWGGEAVWLRRWQGEAETPWVDESESASLATIAQRMRETIDARTTFLAGLTDADLARMQIYRDSKGERFQASLGDMLLQGCIHSTHHRAQAVNMLRRLDAGLVELDYMNRVRQPAN